MADPALTIETWLLDAYGTRSLQRVPEVRPTAVIRRGGAARPLPEVPVDLGGVEFEDRKSTRLNSSH